MRINDTKLKVMMEVAKVISQLSTCRRRSVGCVLLNRYGHIMSTGYNGVARGIPHCTERACPGVSMKSGTGLDVCQAIHAEQNALMQCRDIMQIDVVVVTTSPCMHCMKMLMNTSAAIILFEEAYDYDALLLWQESSIDGMRRVASTVVAGHTK